MYGAGGQKRVPSSYLENFKLYLPSLETQKQIADFLDKETTRIDTLIAKKQRQIELLQEKRQAIITQAVTKGLDPTVKMKDSGVEWIGEIPEHWDSIKLKYVSTKVNSGKTPKGGSESYQDKGVLLIRSQNIYFNGLKLDNVVFIDEETDHEMKHSRVKPNDVLLNITGASIGRSYFVPDGFPSSNVNQHVCIIRPNPKKIMTEYLWLCMASSVIQKVIFSTEKGTSREGITFEQINNFEIPLPKKTEEQSLVVENALYKIGRNAEIVEMIQKSIDLLKEYRSSLITHAVSGQIDISKYEVSHE
jgi:type I restriction enzyme S subunit